MDYLHGQTRNSNYYNVEKKIAMFSYYYIKQFAGHLKKVKKLRSQILNVVT